MVTTDTSTEIIRVNARKTDVFDLFNFKHYIGPNPYLDTTACTFDFSLTGYKEPLPIEDYVAQISDRYPHLGEEKYESHADLFARTALEVSKLDMGLHFDRCSVKPYPNFARISVQTLHQRTTRAVLYFVWDWFEAITQDRDVVFEEQIENLQKQFRASVYGGPTVYALLKAAYQREIPTFDLPDEGLIQYGYGKFRLNGRYDSLKSTDDNLDNSSTFCVENYKGN